MGISAKGVAFPRHFAADICDMVILPTARRQVVLEQGGDSECMLFRTRALWLDECGQRNDDEVSSTARTLGGTNIALTPASSNLSDSLGGALRQRRWASSRSVAALTLPLRARKNLAARQRSTEGMQSAARPTWLRPSAARSAKVVWKTALYEYQYHEHDA